MDTLRAEILPTDQTLAADGLLQTEPTATPSGPFRIGRFTTVRQLGAGGMGVVYMAYDEQLDRKVAVKLLKQRRASSTSSVGHARLLREAQAMAEAATRVDGRIAGCSRGRAEWLHARFVAKVASSSTLHLDARARGVVATNTWSLQVPVLTGAADFCIMV